MRDRHLKNIATKLPDSELRRVVGKCDIEVLETGFASDHTWSQRRFKSDPFFRLYWVEEGETHLQFTDEKFALIPGYFYLIPPNVDFRYHPKSPLKHYWVHFHSQMMESFPFFQTLQSVPEQSRYSARKALKNIYQNAESSVLEKLLLETNLQVRKLIFPFIRKMCEVSGGAPSRELHLFSPVIEYLRTHLSSEVPMAKLAAMTGLSPARFTRDFGRLFGMAPKQFLVQKRMDRAKSMLVQTRLSVREIAHAVGYSNTLFFHRIFKKYSTMTPETYRRNQDLCL